MLLDGRVVYACTARLEARDMRLDPLPTKPLLRDLATVIAAPGRTSATKLPAAISSDFPAPDGPHRQQDRGRAPRGSCCPA